MTRTKVKKTKKTIKKKKKRGGGSGGNGGKPLRDYIPIRPSLTVIYIPTCF
jgi:hypothetical protein